MDTKSVSNLFAEAVSVVNEAHNDEPLEIRTVLIAKAIDLLAGGDDSPLSRPRSSQASGSNEAEVVRPYDKVAAELKITPDQARDLFLIDDSGIHLTVSINSFDKAKKKGTEQIALLLCAAHQAVNGSDSLLDVNVLRHASEERNRYDGPNFSRVFDSEFFADNRKKGNARQIRLKLFGKEAAQELAAQLVKPASANGE